MTRLLRGLRFKVPATYLGAAILLAGRAVRERHARATRLNSTEALRGE